MIASPKWHLCLACLAIGVVTSEPARALPLTASGDAPPPATASKFKRDPLTATDDTHRVAVGKFRGPSAAAFRGVLVRALKEDGDYEIIQKSDSADVGAQNPADTLSPSSSIAAFAAAARTLRVEAILVGTVNARGSLLLGVRGADGRIVENIKIEAGSLAKLKTRLLNSVVVSVAGPMAQIASRNAAKAESDEESKPTADGPAPTPSPPPAPADPREQGLFDKGTPSDSAKVDTPVAAQAAIDETAPANPLTIGGLFYLRSQLSGNRGESASASRLSAPLLAEGYFDARPNDRVRGMLLARMFYDPTADPTADPNEPLLTGPPPSTSPRLLLDQFWLSFDVERTLFVTAGRQHTRWGIGKYFQPTDFLHLSHRDPLAVFDERVGTTTLKLHLPWEGPSWNFYGVALLESADGPVKHPQDVGLAARAEGLLGPLEVGLDVLATHGHQPRVGADASIPLGDFDLYADAAFRAASENRIWRSVNPLGAASLSADEFETVAPPNYKGIVTEAVVGMTWEAGYNDGDVFTLGAEYYYRSAGYTDPKVYPWLILGPSLSPDQFHGTAAAMPFSIGQQYAAVYATLPNPFSWNNTTFSLSTLGNLSDRSFVSRFDYTRVILTHLSVEAFGQLAYGQRGGELQLDFVVPAHCPATQPSCAPEAAVPAFHVLPPLFSVGLALRLAI